MITADSASGSLNNIVGTKCEFLIYLKGYIIYMNFLFRVRATLS